MISKFAKTLGIAAIGSVATIGFAQTFSDSNVVKDFFSQHLRFPVSGTESPKLQSNFKLASSDSKSIRKCQKSLELWKAVNSIPGYVLGVSVAGKTVWIQADGFADLENAVPCRPNTVMRIASISKSITAAMLMKMVEENKIDLDKPIDQYLKAEEFPVKTWEDKPVSITLRQLVSHLGGIRHYKEASKDGTCKDSQTKEFYIREHFENVIESLKLFKDDPLVSMPGTKYVYTTFGWTLISAVMATQLEKNNFPKEFVKFLHRDLGMVHTVLDENEPIVANRARYYHRDAKLGSIRNVPNVDNSCKYAGGGLLSTVPDLLRFGNIMLYSFKGTDQLGRPGFLNKETVNQMWTAAPNTTPEKGLQGTGYGIGWAVIRDVKAANAFTYEPQFSTLISHSGGAVGASSLLLIEPEREIVVALITNLESLDSLGITRIVMEVAEQFAKEISVNISQNYNIAL